MGSVHLGVILLDKRRWTPIYADFIANKLQSTAIYSCCSLSVFILSVVVKILVYQNEIDLDRWMMTSY